MKFINSYIIQAYLTCPREAWYAYHAISADQSHDALTLGRLVHQHSYQRDKKEIFIDHLLKIDLIRDQLVAEIKKSSRHIHAAEMQLLYYLYYLKKNKGLNLHGMLLIPKEKKTIEVILTKEKEEKLEQLIQEIQDIMSKECPPQLKRNKFCPQCAYYEICWS